MDPEARRQQILEAAIRLIGQLGYHGFTVQELARRCGLTNGGLLHYFGSKEQLLVGILEERDRREAAIIPAALDLEREASGETETSRAAVLGVFRAIVARSAAQPELLRLLQVLQTEALNPEHPAHAYFLRREAMVLTEFANVLAGHAHDPRGSARRMLAILSGLEQQWLRSGEGFDLAAECDEAIALVLPRASEAAEPATSWRGNRHAF